MEIGPILLIAMIVIIIGLCVWFYFYNNKPEPVQPDVPVEPEKPDVPDSSTDQDVPDGPGVPDSSTDQGDQDNPDEPVEPIKPDTPDVPYNPTPDSSTEPDIPDEPQKPDPDFGSMLNEILDEYSSVIDVKNNTMTYGYLIDILREVYYQYYNKESKHDIPKLLDEINFPNIYDFYGDKGDQESSFKTAIGWCISLVLSELVPVNRTSIFKIGYELGGYDKYSNIYGYKFEFDPNVMRIFAAAIYASMRGMLKPDIETMRNEMGGSKYKKTMYDLADQDSDYVKDDGFFIDFRKFMPTAPGPYAPGYTTRPDNTYPNEKKDEYTNLYVDREVYEMVIREYNLNEQQHYQDTVQAIADKDADVKHLFGDDRTAGVYQFSPVFGVDTIEERIDPDSELASLVNDAIFASSRSRHILQSATIDPKQYGRLRPGCSWTQEATKHSNTDDRYNVLANFIIEDGDGNPTGYYDKNGNWIYPGTVKSAYEYEELQKKNLWANSYPSGHSSGICGGSMVLMEKMPNKADLILREMNRFAINRTVARYHWTSDTINGRVLGSATNAVAHASSDYDERLKKC